MMSLSVKITLPVMTPRLDLRHWVTFQSAKKQNQTSLMSVDGCCTIIAAINSTQSKAFSSDDDNLPSPPKNPSRHARPVPTSEGLYDFPLISTTEELPGRIPNKVAEALIKKGGPPIVLHPDDHPHQWIRPSPSCKNGEYGFIICIDPPGKARTAIIGIYA